MTNTRKRSVLQVLRDLFEDEAIAFAMAYAGQKGDLSYIRSMEKRISE